MAVVTVDHHKYGIAKEIKKNNRKDLGKVQFHP